MSVPTMRKHVLFEPSERIRNLLLRFRKIEADLSNVNASTTQQMDAFQAKLLELETRIINLERPAT